MEIKEKKEKQKKKIIICCPHCTAPDLIHKEEEGISYSYCPHCGIRIF